MLFGFMYYIARNGSAGLLDRLAFWVYLVAGTGFCMNLLASGQASVARRWAVHLPEWVGYSQVASLLAAATALAALVFALRFLTGMGNARTA